MDVLRNQTELAGYFADCLISQRYPGGIDEQGHEVLKQEIVDQINHEISQVVFDNLTDDQLNELEEMLEEGDGAGAGEFLRSAVPDLRHLILEKLAALREQFNC